MTANKREFRQFINESFNIFDLARYYGVISQDHPDRDVSVYCPFSGETPGASHMSGRLYHQSNSLFNFAQSKQYYAWEFLTLLGHMTFEQIWNSYGSGFQMWKASGKATPYVVQLPLDPIRDNPRIKRYLKNKLPFKDISLMVDDLLTRRQHG